MGNTGGHQGYHGRGFYSGQDLSKGGATSSGGIIAWSQESKVRYGSYQAPS